MADKHPPPQPGSEDWDPYASGKWEQGTPWQGPSNQPPPQPPKRGPWQNQQFGDRARTSAFSGPAAAPQTYLTPAILVTLFCFLPTGIAAIVFAAKVGAKSAAGDFQGAAEASRKARILVLVSVGIGLVFWLLVLLGTVIGSDTSAFGQPPTP